MTRKQIVEGAMALSRKEREKLALELWRSLDETTQEEVWEAWAIEINRRIETLRDDVRESVPAEQIMREARKLVRKKRVA